MESLFLKVKKVNLVVSALVLLALSGCSSTSRVHQLNKEIIALESRSEDSEYQMIIKKQSYGLIGRNEVAKEGYFKLNGVNSYCVAIRAL